MRRQVAIATPINSRRARSRTQSPSHLISLRSRNTHHSTYFLLRGDNRMPDVHTCLILYQPFEVLLDLFSRFAVIVRLPIQTVKTSWRTTHNDYALSLAKVQNHWFL